MATNPHVTVDKADPDAPASAPSATGSTWSRDGSVRRDSPDPLAATAREKYGKAPLSQPARRLVLLFALTMIAFSVAPLWNNFQGWINKDYTLWYRTGQFALHGVPVYPTDHRPFPFMYPPSCAAMLAIASMPGDLPFVVLLLAINSAAWAGSVLLSVYLATGKTLGRHPWLYLVPTLVVVPFVHDMYLLGQPNLVLLLCLLGAFACLRVGRPWCAGGLVALAAGIKAFPILALGYLVYRRQWKAAVSTVVCLALLLVVLPLPLRGARQTWIDLATWTRGMVLKYDEGTIAQRPERSYSFKNQSLIALANRLLRAIPADGEAKDGWHVNVASLDFRSVNAAIVLVSLGLCGFYMAAMPRANRRTERSDAIETAMLLLLILAFNPLSFDYSYVWFIYPLTVALHLIMESPSPSRQRTNQLGWLLAALAVFALALPFRRTAQAYGNLLIADVMLLFILGWQMRPARPSAAVGSGPGVPSPA